MSKKTLQNRSELLEVGKREAPWFLLETDSGRPRLLYPRSLESFDDMIFCILKEDSGEKWLGISVPRKEHAQLEAFDCSEEAEFLSDDTPFFFCPWSHNNALALRRLFPHTVPSLVGPQLSFGLGDRLGLANPAHLRALRGSGIRPVLAQQSIRELLRTERTPEAVVDVATFSVFQEGWKEGFGADADHLKEIEDIERTVESGFRMFTIDPGDEVVNQADSLPESELLIQARNLAWNQLEDTMERCLARYAGSSFDLTGLTLTPTRLDVLQSMVKYGPVVRRVNELYRSLARRLPREEFEIELSVDETDSVTTPFEHFWIVRELGRLGIKLDGIAPRFVGALEKGIDYKGDPKELEEQIGQHYTIATHQGSYKLSLHSGSDKFSIYEIFSRLPGQRCHIKTAGTSYLEALRAVAMIDMDFFLSILEFSVSRYDEARRSYHVSASLSEVPTAEDLQSDIDHFFSHSEDLRQILHVAYGDVLTERDPNGRYRFRSRLLRMLTLHEDIHYDCVEKHFSRHIQPFLSD